MNMNPVGWFEIYVSNMERAKKFYEDVFGKKLERLPDPTGKHNLEMWAFPMFQDGFGAAGTLCKMSGMEPRIGGTLVYFSCQDCSVEEKRAQTHGGKVVNPKMSIGQHGFISLVQDTEGNMIGLHSMK